MLPEKIPQLDISIADQPGVGQLLRASTYEFRYVKADKDQLPEGELFMQIRAMFPKQPTTAMHMLALIGHNGIGRLGYRIPGAPALPAA